MTAPAKKTELDLESVQGKYLTFMLAGESYGLQILKVQEIISLMTITRVPRAPQFVLGVINLRGKVIPVIDMRLKFGLPKTDSTEKTCIIVVQIERNDISITVGIVVDEVSEVVDLKASQISQTPSLGAGIDTAFIMGMGKIADLIVMLLDLDKAFSSEVVELLSESAS